MTRLERFQPGDRRYANSWAVVAGEVIYVAGMVGMENDFLGPGLAEELVFPEGIEAQMRQAYRNIERILNELGASITDVAQQTLFFTGDGHEAMGANQVVRPEVFGDRIPASAMMGVNNLFDPRCRIEIQVIAHRGAG